MYAAPEDAQLGKKLHSTGVSILRRHLPPSNDYDYDIYLHMANGTLEHATYRGNSWRRRRSMDFHKYDFKLTTCCVYTSGTTFDPHQTATHLISYRTQTDKGR